MSRDPFDLMKSRDPARSDQSPQPPAGLAKQIVWGGSREPRRRTLPGFALAAISAAIVLVIGGGVFMLTRPASNGGFAAGDATTTTVVTSDIVTTTVVGVPTSETFTLFFLADQAGEGWEGGPFLVAFDEVITYDVLWPDHNDTTRARVALERLIEGVDGWSSAIPEGTELIGWGDGMTRGSVKVDLSSEFVSGGGSFSMQARLAQVVYTLTDLGYRGVEFSIDGVPTTVFGGEGVTVGVPAMRDEFEALLPAIMVESPGHMGYGGNPLVVRGTANVFEATVSLTLTDADGVVLWEGFTTASCGTGCRGEWSVTIPHDYDGLARLHVWEASGEDGRRLNEREQAIRLSSSAVTTTTQPPADAMGCSGENWSGELPEQGGLPSAVAASRAAIWDAAIECDWDQLGRLVGDGIAFSFGQQGSDAADAIAYWKSLEEYREIPMWILAEILTMPFRALDAGGAVGETLYVWPDAYGVDWEDVDSATIDLLEPFYGPDSVAAWEQFGAYLGYRIGIASDGTWLFFIAGD